MLAILLVRAAYGYEITAWLRDQGFADIAEGTVYALLVRIEQRGLVDVEKVPSEKGPPRKVYSLNARGGTISKSSGGRGASSLNDWNSSTKEEIKWQRSGSSWSQGARAEEAVQAIQGPHRGPARAVRHRRERAPAVLDVLRGHHGW